MLNYVSLLVKLRPPCHPSNRMAQFWSLGQHQLFYFASFLAVCVIVGCWDLSAEKFALILERPKGPLAEYFFVAGISSSLSLSSTGVSSTSSSSNTP